MEFLFAISVFLFTVRKWHDDANSYKEKMLRAEKVKALMGFSVDKACWTRRSDVALAGFPVQVRHPNFQDTLLNHRWREHCIQSGSAPARPVRGCSLLSVAESSPPVTAPQWDYNPQ